MKKQLIRVLALTAATLCFAGGALAGDVPTCPMVTWEEYAASCGAYCGETSSACTSANGLSWATGADVSCGASSGSCAASWTAGAYTPAQSASKNGCTGADASCSVPSGSCAASRPSGTCSPAQSANQNGCSSGCRNDGWCDGQHFDSFDADDSHCIFSFGAESDCTQAPSAPDGNYTAQSVSPQESALYQMINEDRLANGISALPLDETLSAIARAKSEDMIENGYFAHESPTYGRAAEMLDEFGYEYTSVGENIARNGSVEKAHAALMSSSSHVRNILGSQWKAVGVGVANDGNGYPYVTELFVR